MHAYTAVERPDEVKGAVAWPRGLREEVRPHASGGLYLNIVAEDEGESGVRAAFGEYKYERLAAIKARYDADNVFRGNHNSGQRP